MVFLGILIPLLLKSVALDLDSNLNTETTPVPALEEPALQDQLEVARGLNDTAQHSYIGQSNTAEQEDIRSWMAKGIGHIDIGANNFRNYNCKFFGFNVCSHKGSPPKY